MKSIRRMKMAIRTVCALRTAVTLSFCIFSLLFCTSCSLNNSKASLTSFSKIEEGILKLPDFPYETWKLANGLTVYFSQDKELPLVSVSLLIPGGTIWEQASEAGLYEALGDNMRLGGAGKFSPQDLDRELEKYAASISSDYGAEYGTIGFSSLSSDFDHIFSLMSDVLLRPNFDRERLSLWKGQTLEGIRRRIDDPGTIASLSVRQMLIGDTSYGAILTSQDITAITRQKLRALHAKAIIPNTALLAISGNITRQQAEEAVNRYLGGWQAAAQPLSPPPPFPNQKNAGIVFIEQPLAQATILIGQLGPERLSPDQYAIDLFNHYFGSGGFGSLLMKRIRTERGLAYGVFGSMFAGLGRGRALIHLQTKTESAGEAAVETLKCLEEVKSKEIATADLIESRNSISNAFIFNFAAASQVLSRRVQFDLLKYPRDFDQLYLENIKSVTPRDIREVAKARWNYSDFVIVIVGPKRALESFQAAQRDLPAPLDSAHIQIGAFDEVLRLQHSYESR